MRKFEFANLVAAAFVVGSLGFVDGNTAEASALVIEKNTIITTQGNPEMIELMHKAARDMAVIDNTTGKLKVLNTMRGGKNGFSGFVGEHLEAQAASLEGKATTVVNDNGLVDLVYKGKNGHKYPQQLKLGYPQGNIDLAKYKGQTVLVDKAHNKLADLAKKGREVGVKVKEAHITKAEPQVVADLMQKETAITGAKNASIVPEVKGVMDKVVVAHEVGSKVAKSSALAGGAFSLGNNLVKVAKGEKELGEAAKDVALDTAVATGVGYAVGTVGSAVAGTAAGSAALGTVAAAATSATSAVAGTAVGSAALAAGSAATAAVGAAGTAAATATVGALATVGSAVGSAAVAATSAVAGTAAAGTVASGIGAMAAGGAALGAAAIAAAPVVAVGAVIGGLYAWLCD